MDQETVEQTATGTINSQPTGPRLKPDLVEARKHLNRLDPSNETFVFQTFDDSNDKNPKLARVISGTLDQCAPQLEALNNKGAGVFVTVNMSRNGGRKKEDISACRAVFREADRPDLPALPILPHFTVESSPGKKHEYLLTESTSDFETWERIMRTMVDQHGSDPKAKDLSRVLRLAGFYHRKHKPHPVKIIYENNTARYTLDSIFQHIPPAKIQKQKPAVDGLIGAANKYGATALANELTVLLCTSKGGRNDQLNRSAHALGQLVAGGELEQHQVEQALTAAALGIGLSPSEVKATISSGLSSGMANPRKAPKTIQAGHPNNRTGTQRKNYSKNSVVNLVTASQIKPEPVSWIWNGYIARGKVHIIAGPPGHGKTTLLLALMATLSIGGRWPDGTWAEAYDVAIWSGEDDPADTLIPRLLACGADLKRVHIVRGVTEGGEKRSFDPSTDISKLMESIQSKNIKMLVIDPIVSAVGGDSHKNAETRRALQPLVDLAADLNCAVYGVTHFTKGTVGRDPVERVTGSLAFGALTRIVTVAMKLSGNGEHPKDARLFARAKSNIGPDGGGFHYFFDLVEIPGHEGMFNTRVLWGNKLDGTAKELIAQAEVFGTNQGVTRAATEWLAEFLSEGPMPAAKVKKAARKMGFSRTTLQRAKARLGIKPLKAGFTKGWVWVLPRKTDEESAKVPHTVNTESSGQNSIQVTDSVEDSAKIPKTRNLRSNPPLERERRFQGSESSDRAAVDEGLGGVETTKIPHSTVLESSELVGIFERDKKTQQSDLWEVEI